MFEILEGYITVYDATASPPAPTKLEFSRAGFTIDYILSKDGKTGSKKADKVGLREIMEALGLQTQELHLLGTVLCGVCNASVSCGDQVLQYVL